jgi:formylglycine-generating enzyme required for sulfatase activity
VSWVDLTTWLTRAGLQLPSEAQWEYAARGGTDTPWWTGSERESLAELRAANLADESAVRGGAAWASLGQWPGFDDGFIVHAPVTAFAPNPFGLYGMVGTVFELCRDGYDAAYYAHSPHLDPLCDETGRVTRVARGGGYDHGAEVARAGARGYYTPSTFNGAVGARAARSLDP